MSDVREKWQIETDNLKERVGKLEKDVDGVTRDPRGSNNTIWLKILTPLIFILLSAAIGGGIYSGAQLQSLNNSVGKLEAKVDDLPSNVSEKLDGQNTELNRISGELRTLETGLKNTAGDLNDVTQSLSTSATLIRDNTSRIQMLADAANQLRSTVEMIKEKTDELGNIKELSANIKTATNKAHEAIDLAEKSASDSKAASEQAVKNADELKLVAKNVNRFLSPSLTVVATVELGSASLSQPESEKAVTPETADYVFKFKPTWPDNARPPAHNVETEIIGAFPFVASVSSYIDSDSILFVTLNISKDHRKNFASFISSDKTIKVRIHASFG